MFWRNRQPKGVRPQQGQKGSDPFWFLKRFVAGARHAVPLRRCTIWSFGYSLVEVLIALSILAFGLVPVIEGMARSAQASRISEDGIRAAFVAEKKINENVLTMIVDRRLPFGSQDGREKIPGKEFHWQTSADSYIHESLKDITKVSQVIVKVEWNEGSRGKNQIATGTLLTERKKEI